MKIINHAQKVTTKYLKAHAPYSKNSATMLII